MKSYFYGKNLAELHNKKAVRVKETKTGILVEYIYKYDWPENLKKQHPRLADYCVRCFGKNAKNVPFKAGLLQTDKKEGHFFFQYGPSLETVDELLANPKAIYEMTNKEIHNLHL